MSTETAFPEWLSRQDTAPEAWVVEPGTPRRGDAWTNLVQHRMRVPTGADEVSRVVRAHEMVHAKVSPVQGVPPELAEAAGVEPQSLVVAEEFRVNLLAREAGFNMDDLRDGSEVLSGELAGRNGDWNSAVNMVCATAGTKAANDYIRGVGKHHKEMAAALRLVHTEIKKRGKSLVKRHHIDGISSTSVWHNTYGDPVPLGFKRFTIPIAEYIDSLLMRQADGEDGDKYSKAGGIPSSKAIKSGTGAPSFATLIEKKVPKPQSVDGRLGRKRRPAAIGKNPRRIERLLTDPDKRVFDRRARARGGVVLIDQSGSMCLNEDQIWDIIKHAPGSVIIGYSHYPGSTDIPNVWVIADRGRVADHVPNGNTGNGVDGPAIRFAAERRRKGEPFIWVCDGMVTDGESDTDDKELDIECVDLVRQHGIHMVRDVDDAIAALKQAANGTKLPTRLTGNLRSYESRLVS